MKNFALILISAAMLVLLGCVPQGRAPVIPDTLEANTDSKTPVIPDTLEADTDSKTLAQTQPEMTSLEFAAQYIRTDGYDSSRKYPVITLVKSCSELGAYYDGQKGNYDFGSRETVYADSTISFNDAVSAYDKAFFEEKCLVLIVLEESSGSYRHNATDVVLESDVVTVIIQRNIPDICTCDMAQWHIIIELGKEAAGYEFRADIADVNVP